MDTGEFLRQLVEVFTYLGGFVSKKKPGLGLLIIIGSLFVLYFIYIRYRSYLKFKIKKKKHIRKLKPIFINE